MKTIFATFFLSILCIIPQLHSAPNFAQYKKFISSSEGVRNTVYKDTMGNYTVGIGHLLGKNYEGKQFYTNAEINSLFANDLQVALKDAKFLFPSFNEQPDEIQLILTSLSFNLGLNKLSKFHKFRAAINENNYQLAANELVNSRWYSQVGNRGVKYVSILRGIN